MRDGDMLNLCVERLYAYICQKCNFIQINEENMRKHLTIQHEMPEKNCDNHYRKILLMNKTKELPSDRSRGKRSNFSCLLNIGSILEEIEIFLRILQK